MKSFIAIIAIAACIAVTGCATKSVSVSRYVDSSQRGVLYALPKTLLRITVPYTVSEETERKHGIDINTESVVDILKPISLTPMLAADPAQVYVASVDAGSDSAFLASNLNFKLSDDGLLTAVVGDMKDKSLEALSAAVSAGVQIAKVAAVAGTRQVFPDEIKGIEKRIASLYAAMGEVSPEGDTSAVDRIEALRAEIELLQNIAAEYQAANANRVRTWDVEYTIVVDPMNLDFDEQSGCFMLKNITPEELVPEIPQDEMPTVRLALKVPHGVDKAKAAAPVAEARSGILYRLPVPVECSVFVNDSLKLQDFVRMPQFGPIGCAPVESKKWADRKSSLVFSPKTGGLTGYSVVAGDSAEKAVTVLEDAGKTIQTGREAIKYDLKIEELNKKVKLLEAEQKLKEKKSESDNE